MAHMPTYSYDKEADVLYFLEPRRRLVDEAKIDHAARQKIYEDNARQLLQLG